jgi:ComF family protein
MIRSSILRLLNNSLNLIYPARCPVCGGKADNFATSPICKDCWSKIIPLDEHCCQICSKPLGAIYMKICADCLKTKPYYTKVISFTAFEGTIREAIHLYKYSSITRFADAISQLMFSLELPEADIMTAVPVTKKRLQERGFNQSLLLARKLGKRFNIPAHFNLLAKIKETEHQALLKGQERRAALKGAFVTTEKINGQVIILVDDVMTTGTTINECSKTLISGGASKVYAIVAANTRKN